MFKNNGKRWIGRQTGSEIGSDKEPITVQTKQEFVSVDDSIAKPTANEFLKAADDITIHVGESASNFKDGTRRTTANKFVNTANFSEPSIANICIFETVFHEESGCPYGDVPSLLFYLRFSTFQFHVLYVGISLNRLIRKETILSCFFLAVRGLGPM